MIRRLQSLALALLALTAIALWSTIGVRPTATGVLTVRALDVGQGDTILVTTPLGRSILVDAGPSREVTTTLDRMLPLARRRLDLVVVSHNHSDHIGGLPAVLERYPVGELWLSGAVHTTSTYLQLLETIRNRSIAIEVVSAGKTAVLDGVRFTVLFPLSPQRAERPENQHDASVVVLVEYGQRSMLLMGDAEAAQEADLLASGQLTKPIDVLKVGHHGSNSSSTEPFLDALKPAIALISAGAGNSYGHPHQVVLDRLAARGAQLLRTDQRGTVTIGTDGQQLWTETQK